MRLWVPYSIRVSGIYQESDVAVFHAHQILNGLYLRLKYCWRCSQGSGEVGPRSMNANPYPFASFGYVYIPDTESAFKVGFTRVPFLAARK